MLPARSDRRGRPPDDSLPDWLDATSCPSGPDLKRGETEFLNDILDDWRAVYHTRITSETSEETARAVSIIVLEECLDDLLRDARHTTRAVPRTTARLAFGTALQAMVEEGTVWQMATVTKDTSQDRLLNLREGNTWLAAGGSTQALLDLGDWLDHPEGHTDLFLPKLLRPGATAIPSVETITLCQHSGCSFATHDSAGMFCALHEVNDLEEMAVYTCLPKTLHSTYRRRSHANPAALGHLKLTVPFVFPTCEAAFLAPFSGSAALSAGARSTGVYSIPYLATLSLWEPAAFGMPTGVFRHCDVPENVTEIYLAMEQRLRLKITFPVLQGCPSIGDFPSTKAQALEWVLLFSFVFLPGENLPSHRMSKTHFFCFWPPHAH